MLIATILVSLVSNPLLWASFILAYLLTPFMITLAHRYNILDIPRGSLKTHKEPTAYLGGVAVFLPLLILGSFTFMTQAWHTFFILGALLLLIVGLGDDMHSFSPGTKFILQGIGCITLLIATISYTRIPCTWLMGSLGLFFLWTMVNAVNLVDIMDGLASSLAACAALGLAILAYVRDMSQIATIALIFAGALLGFLVYNKRPARIYLGDAGALMIGGVVGFLSLSLAWDTTLTFNFFVPPLIAGIFLAEVVYLMVIRTYLRIPFYNGSPHHFALYLKRKNWEWWHIISFVLVIGTLLNLLAYIQQTGIISPIQLVTLVAAGLGTWTWIIYFNQPNS